VVAKNTGPIRGWDDYMEALAQKPPYQQYADQLRVQDMVRTAEQLAQFGVSYPHRYFGIREDMK
jgi:hypothetical protein